jgi:predicted O-linked N-acetylglucosamine transferase (SPINDLY family)
MNFNKALGSVLDFYQKGNFKQAEELCKKILKKKPTNSDALHLLGMIYFELGEHTLSINYIQKALQFDPDFAEAFNNLGNIFQKLNRFEEAISCYQKAVELNPTLDQTFLNLGIALQDVGRLDEAIPCYQKALSLNPHLFGAYNNLGLALQTQESLDEAIQYYQTALQLKPDFAEAHYNMANALKEIGQLDEAITYYQKATQLNSNYAEAYYNLGNVLKEQNKMDEAIGIYDMALSCKPNFVRARWARLMSQLPIIYPNQSSIQSSRKRYYDELMKVREMFSLKTPQDIEAAAEAVGSHQPFLLACQGFNNRELQQLYGDLVCRIMALRYPQFAEPPIMIPRLSSEPLRIGIVSAYFCRHSVWKIPLKGWVQNLDRQRFCLYGYYTGRKKDNETEVARQCFNRFIEDIQSFEELCQTIRDDNLHVLIYPEIGMDSVTMRLACMKLSPVQCTSLGHPDTSGLPTIDYYLSSDLMEPPDADDHYSERLIRLPNLSVYYTSLEIPNACVNRDTFGLRSKSILYLCTHSLFTHLPQYDEVYPRIAQEVRDCQFLFISYPKSTLVTEQFRLRISQAFRKFNLNANEFIVFLPYLDAGQYHAINCLSDIFLDTMGWSANNSTFEAIACNLPVVTLPGSLMRQRHCAAILTMMGVKETIASSLDEYIAFAIRLGQDLTWRQQISGKIAQNKHLVYQDRTCITALEDFLGNVVRERIE